MDKPEFQRVCPDCGRTFTVGPTYSDNAYRLHASGSKDAVCNPCFEGFNGITINELLRQIHW